MVTWNLILRPNISKVWTQTALVIEEAVHLDGTHELDDVLKKLLDGSALLWVQWNDALKRIEAAVITEIVVYPKTKHFHIWLAGALRGAKTLWPDLWAKFLEVAKHLECSKITVKGRRGWMRIVNSFKQDGYILAADVP